MKKKQHTARLCHHIELLLDYEIDRKNYAVANNETTASNGQLSQITILETIGWQACELACQSIADQTLISTKLVPCITKRGIPV